jgi:NAD(P)H dehydrogenase (quinone)
MSFSYRPELGEAIATILTSRGHEGRRYDVVTPPPVSLGELAQTVSEATGRDYRYEPSSHEAWDERWRAEGRTGWRLEAGHTVYEAIRAGEFDVSSDDFRTITGRDPLTVAQIVERLVSV